MRIRDRFRGHVSFAVGQCLLAGIAVGYLIIVGFGDLDIVSEYLVILDFQILDLGQLPLFGLQIRDPLMPVF